MIIGFSKRWWWSSKAVAWSSFNWSGCSPRIRHTWHCAKGSSVKISICNSVFIRRGWWNLGSMGSTEPNTSYAKQWYICEKTTKISTNSKFQAHDIKSPMSSVLRIYKGEPIKYKFWLRLYIRIHLFRGPSPFTGIDLFNSQLNNESFV